MSNELQLVDNYDDVCDDAYNLAYSFESFDDRTYGRIYVSKKREIASGQTGVDKQVWSLTEPHVINTLDEAWNKLSYPARVQLDWFRAMPLVTNGVN